MKNCLMNLLALFYRSKDYKCSECGNINNVLKPVTEESEKTKQEIKELASQIDFKVSVSKGLASTGLQIRVHN